MDRKTVIAGLDELAESVGDMAKYFKSLGLAGALKAGFNGEDKYSYKGILKAFSYHYQKLSGNIYSLFDPINTIFSPLIDLPKALANHAYADNFIYERLIRKNANIKALGSLSMSEVVKGMARLPSKLSRHLESQGFKTIVRHTYLRDLPLPQAVLTGCANHLRRVTNDDIRLLDESRPYHVKFSYKGSPIYITNTN